MNCRACGHTVGLFNLQNGVCKSCVESAKSSSSSHDKVSDTEAVNELMRNKTEAANQTKREVEKIKLTTAYKFANNEILDEVAIVTSECVFGMNIFRDFFSGMTDFFGGRSSASQKVLRDARNTCLKELKKEAYDLGADGVMGIDLDYSEISGKDKGMLFLVASGTAVKLKPKSAV